MSVCQQIIVVLLWMLTSGQKVLSYETGSSKENPSHNMAHNLKINVATYNLHGFNQGSSFLEYLSVYNDVVFVQEHWLAPFNVNQLESACPSYVCYATFATNDVISSGVLRVAR